MNDKKRFHFDNIYRSEPRVFDGIILYQVGDLSCAGNYEIGDHIQFCHEISYVVSGKGRFFTNGRSYPVCAGDVYLNLPGERHNGIADPADPFRFFYLGYDFEPRLTEQNTLTHIRKMFGQVVRPIQKDRFNLQEPFLHIFSEIINARQDADLMLQTCLQQILMLAYRDFFENWEKAYQPQTDAQSPRRLVYEVIHYIDVHLADLDDLAKIAAELDYSYAYLSRVFTQETGLGIQDYYQRKRFAWAAELLQNTGLSITRVAGDLRYQSIHSFSKAFRKRFGLSPSEYKILCQKSQNRNNEAASLDKD